MKIIPTVLAYDMRSFNALFRKLLPITDTIQVDLMDGRFVRTKSITLEKVPSVKRYRNKLFEAHLMVREPMPWAAELASKGFKRIIFHYEAVWPEDLPLIARFLKTQGVESMIALNPGTPVKDVAPYAKLFNGVLFLGVHPGRNGAPYVMETPKRIKQLRKTYKGIIQVDGGMTPLTAPEVAAAGADRINTGSFVGGARDPERALMEMERAAR